MKNVWEACEFSNDVISADFSKAKFAVELHEFLDNRAGDVYQDPETFFHNTFPTDQMKLLVKDVLKRLHHGTGTPVTIIDTGFGGGKTHSLLLLHHILNSPDKGMAFIKDCGMESEFDIHGVPPAKVVTIDCREIGKKTLWGEIAYRLGEYERFQAHDESMTPLLEISQLKQLFNRPVLLLIDELPHYLLKADSIRTGNLSLADLTIAFVMELISAISASKNSYLVLTLTEKQQLYESYSSEVGRKVKKTMLDYETDVIDGKIHEAISRQPNMITPVKDDQIYDVVRARLVQKIDVVAKKATIDEYARYYEDRGISYPDFRKKAEKSYPFHPMLIEILHTRVSTIPKFNKTRGMLRLLAMVIRQIVNEKPDCKIIGLGDIQLSSSDIVDELTVRLDKNLNAVISADCVEHARQFDRKKSIRIVEPIARTILMFSLHGQPKKAGMRLGEIRRAVCFPGLDPAVVDAAIKEDIMENFWYIRDHDGQEFYFVESPNINSIIHEHRTEVTQEEIKGEIRNTLKKLLPRDGFVPIIWNSESIEDTDALKIFVLDYSERITDGMVAEFIKKTLDQTPTGSIRTYKNTLVFVYADPNMTQLLKDRARELAAIKRGKKDERMDAGKSFLSQIAGKESAAEANLGRECMNTYSKVGYPYGFEPRLDEIKLGESKSNTIMGAVTELLKNKGKLVDSLGKDGIDNVKDVKRVQEVYDSYTTDKSKPFLLHRDSIIPVIRDGVKDGKFGFCDGIEMVGDKYKAEIGVELNRPSLWGGYIVNKDMIYHKPYRVDDNDGNNDGQLGGETEPTEPSKIYYGITLDDFKTICGFANVLTFLNLDESWKSAQKELQSKVMMKGTTITMQSSLDEPTMLKGILGSVSGSGTKGSGRVSIASDKPLDDLLKKHGMEFEKE